MISEKRKRLLKIVKRHTHGRITTLESRFSDRLDFHEIAVWTLKGMLDAAYEVGYQGGCARDKVELEASDE